MDSCGRRRVGCLQEKHAQTSRVSRRTVAGLNRRALRTDHRCMPVIRSSVALSVPALIAACCGTAAADFTGFVLTRSVADGASDQYRVVRAYARFDDAADVLLNVFDASLTLSSGGTDIPGFLQAFDPDLEAVESFRPMAWTPGTEAWDYDSFVTIGAEQGAMSNGTVLDPGFDDSGAASGLGFGGTSGWYNLPPTNGHGTAGADLSVFVGQFVVPSSAFVPGMRLRFAATVGVNAGGVLQFGEHEVSCVLPLNNVPKYVIDDLDGDAMSDLLLFNRAAGTVSGWLMSGSALKSESPIVADSMRGYALQGIGDADGDGDADVLWRRGKGGDLALWRLSGLKTPEMIPLGPNPGRAWQILAMTDVSGDSLADVVLFNRRTREVMVWILDGEGIAETAVLGANPGATPLGVGDLDGDGRRDILWRLPTGVAWGWLLDGTSVRESAAIAGIEAPIGRSWKVAGIADIDGDGADDVVWRESSAGAVTWWRMEGLRAVSVGLLSNSVAPTWIAEAAPDIDGDGRADILWRRKSDSAAIVWRMEGAGQFASDSLPALPFSYTVAKPKMNRF